MTTEQPEETPEATPAEPQSSDAEAASQAAEPVSETESGAETPEVSSEPPAPTDVPDQTAAEIAAPVDVPDQTAAEVAAPVGVPDQTAAEVAAPVGVETSAGQLRLGEGDAVEEPGEQPVPRILRGKIDKQGVAIGTGRRKTSVARVRVKQGTGEFTINGRSVENYFNVERDRMMVAAPLKATDSLGQVDIWVRVQGGGTTGQAGAIVLGIARALEAMHPEFHHTLSDGGYLTRDGRMVERKKYGYKKARKSFQFSKR